jgi:hypothetical protein
MASTKTLDKSIGHVCGSIFAAASKQLPDSGGNGPPLLCVAVVAFRSGVIRRRMTHFERWFLPMGNPLGHREHRRELETGLQYPARAPVRCCWSTPSVGKRSPGARSTSTGFVCFPSDHCPGDPPAAGRPEASRSWRLSGRFTRCLISAIRARGGAHTRHAHSRAVLSSLAVTTSLPSGLKAACHTPPWCPDNTWSACPLATSHSRAVSWLAVTTSLPSGLKAAYLTVS